MELQQQQEDREKQWDGGELLACALVQLLLVNVAYRIDRQKSAPLLSTSSWAIFCGLGVREPFGPNRNGHLAIARLTIALYARCCVNSAERCCPSCPNRYAESAVVSC